MSSPTIPVDFSFSIRRVLLWIRNLLVAQVRTMGLAAGVLAAGYWAVYLLILWGTGSRGLPTDGLMGLMIAGLGVVLGSRSFRDLHRPHRTAPWLLLPASILEKFVGTVVLIAAILALFPVFQVLIDLVAQGLGFVLFGRNLPAFDPTDHRFLNTYVSVLAASPLFVFGSVFFRSAPLLKTLLSVAVGALGAALFVLALTFVLFGDFSASLSSMHWSEGVMTWGAHRYRLDSPALQVLGGVIRVVGDVLFWAVMPVFFLVAGFLKLTEIEARDGLS